MLETLLINGTDITTIAPCIQVIDGMFAVPPPRGANPQFPGINGEMYVEKPHATGAIVLALIFEGSNLDLATLNDRYRALKQLVKPGKTVTMTRRISLPSGTQETTAPGEYASGLAPAIRLNKIANLILTMKVLSGVWYGSSIASALPSVIVHPGDALTNKIMITMTAGTITNQTTGHQVTYAGPGTATVDVFALTAVEGATNTSRYLSWPVYQDYPLALLPGSNDVRVSGGIASLSYFPAYY